MKVICPALLSERYFPARCTSPDMPGGMNISPNVVWTDVPRNTRSFILTIVDHHLSAEPIVHWAAINIPAGSREILEKSSGIRDRMPAGSLELRNDFGDDGYRGPGLPAGSQVHHYAITVYAIDEEKLEYGPHAPLQKILSEVDLNILASGTMIGSLQ